mgnify:CR=1 FL=1
MCVAGRTMMPWDAWTVREGAPEPAGSHATRDGALVATEGSGCVTRGLTFEAWHPQTNDSAKRVLREALKGSGIRARTT